MCAGSESRAAHADGAYARRAHPANGVPGEKTTTATANVAPRDRGFTRERSAHYTMGVPNL